MMDFLRRLVVIVLSIALVVPACAESKTIAGDPNNVNGAASYVYDPVGNRTQKTSTVPGCPGGLTNYNANDQLTTDTYDNDGNTTASNGLGYVYDFENHVIQAGGGITMVYDGDGNRFSKTVAGVTTKYLVDTQSLTGYPQVVFESYSGSTSANHELSRIYVYGLERISQMRSYFLNNANHTQTSYYVYDGHGSTRALTDPSGNVTDTYDYDAFGNIVHSTATGIPPGGTTVTATPNEFLFAGEQFDSDLNLFYNRARYLNVSTGRFWSMDTFEGDQEEPLSLHKYLYVSADPVGRHDPSGREGLVDVMIAIAVFTTVEAISVPSTGVDLIRVRQIQYQSTGHGIAIKLGALTRNKIPFYPEYRWVQFVTTDDPTEGAPANTPYNDPQPPDDDKPYYYTDEEEPRFHNQYGYDYVFIDNPSRNPADAGTLGRVTWHADLSLTGVSPAGGLNYTSIVKISYGFTIDNTGETLEPLAIGR